MAKKIFSLAAAFGFFLGCAEIPDELREADGDKVCGSSVYSPSTSFCYDGVVYPKCDGIKYDPTSQICQAVAVCGDKQYNPSSQRCCNGNTYNPSSQRCRSGVVESKCGSEWYNTSTQRCYGNNVYDLCNGKTYNPSTQRCGTNSVIENKCGSEWYNPAAYVQYCKNGVLTPYGSITDSRDGKTYRTVEIDTQTWMAQNLNYNATGSKCDNGGSLSDANTSACDTYGRLYDWSTAMGIPSSYNTRSYTSPDIKYQGVCPEDWHIPNDDEWNALMTAVGGFSTAGTKLKATNGWVEGQNGEDTYGFSALPGGDGRSDGSSSYVGYVGYWWSSSEDASNYAYHRDTYYCNEYAACISSDKSRLFSVRCVQD